LWKGVDCRARESLLGLSNGKAINRITSATNFSLLPNHKSEVLKHHVTASFLLEHRNLVYQESYLYIALDSTNGSVPFGDAKVDLRHTIAIEMSLRIEPNSTLVLVSQPAGHIQECFSVAETTPRRPFVSLQFASGGWLSLSPSAVPSLSSRPAAQKKKQILHQPKHGQHYAMMQPLSTRVWRLCIYCQSLTASE
jgi:hypothetical protein